MKTKTSTLVALLMVLSFVLFFSCDHDFDQDDEPAVESDDDSTVPSDDDDDDDNDDNNDNDNDDDQGKFKVMTFNVGTTTGLFHDFGPIDGYTQNMAQVTDDFYHNSLSWNPAEEALTDFLETHRPHIVAFQELFYDPWCEEIVVDPTLDFVCKNYTAERPLQMERLLGENYQVACAVGQEDNCVGIDKSFGTFRGCPLDEPCMDGLFGMGPPSGCSNGARVGSILIDLADGTELVLVNVHGTSGFKFEDMNCRADQFEQIFIDRGDGQPAAYGQANLVMGDINTDPFLASFIDVSARTWNQYVGAQLAFDYISSDSAAGPGTYFYGLAHIDHVISDTILGECVVPGSSDGVPGVMDAVYWDHSPVLCTVEMN